MNRFAHRPGLMPGAVASAVAYECDDLPVGEHRGLPSPWVTFIVAVGGPVRVAGTVLDEGPADWAAATSYDVLVSGLHPTAARVEQPSRQAGVQLALHPLAAPDLLGCRAADLLTAGDHGHEVLGRDAVELHERVGGAATQEERLDLVEHWFRRRAPDRPRSVVRPEVAHAWRLVQHTRGRIRVDDLARQVMLSPRQLRTLVQREVGLTPKQLCRHARFDAVIEALAGGEESLATVAARTGHADQSHLTREFHELAGCSPTTWLAEERRNLQDGGHRNRPDSAA